MASARMVSRAMRVIAEGGNVEDAIDVAIRTRVEEVKDGVQVPLSMASLSADDVLAYFAVSA
jgi:hypothetical protein